MLKKIKLKNINKNKYIRSKIKNRLYIKSNKINIITDTIKSINIKICNSVNYEINKDVLINNIYLYLHNLLIFNNMKIILDDVKLLITFNAYNKYYLINKQTKIIIINNNNYKLYNNNLSIDNKNLSFITFNVKHINGNCKRNLLDDINLLNIEDFNEELNNNKNCLYVDKKFNILSNNCKFEVKITFMNLILEDDKKQMISESIYNFTDNEIDEKKLFYEKSCYMCVNQDKLKKINYLLYITIEDGPINNYVYDFNELKNAIYNKLKFNYVKMNDIFKININYDILTIKIININNNNEEHLAYYINNEITIKIRYNENKRIFAYDAELIVNVESLDVNIKHYNNTTIYTLFDKNNSNNILDVNVDHVKNLVMNIKYFLYDEPIKLIDKMILEYKNIIVKNKSILDNCLLVINYNTKINITKDDDCNIKLINNQKNNNNNINMNINEIKNIKNKLKEYDITGMDEQIDILIKEILLPRTDLIDEKLKKLIKLPKGIILYGPSGCGKTTLCKNFAKIIGICDSKINMINGPEIFNKYVGASEENIRNLFQGAKKDKNSLHLVIIDECDSIFKSRDNESSCNKSDIVNQFLGELDGLIDINNIIIFGLTNRIDIIDKALLRPGRFGTKIYCGLPNKKQRLDIVELYYNKIKESIDFNLIDINKIVENTENLSGAEIENIFTKIIQLHINSKIINQQEIIITDKTFDDIINKIKIEK